MKESKKYYIRARQPKHNRGKYRELPYLDGCNVHTDDLVVSVHDMENRWREWLAPDHGEGERVVAALEAEWQAEEMLAQQEEPKSIGAHTEEP